MGGYKRLWLCCIASSLVLAFSTGSAAQSASVYDLRLSVELDTALIDEAQRAYVWRITWTAIYAGLALGAAAAAPFVPDTDQPAYWVGAISSGVSALFTWLLPLDVEASPRALAALRDAHGTGARRARARALYAAASADEHSRVTWPWHALNAGLAVIPAAILLVGYDQLFYAALQLGAGVLLGEIALFTQPTNLTTRTQPSARSGAFALTIAF